MDQRLDSGVASGETSGVTSEGGLRDNLIALNFSKISNSCHPFNTS